MPGVPERPGLEPEAEIDHVMETDMADADQFIVDTIRTLIKRRGDVPPEISPESLIGADLDLDSLELAELSAALEDKLGRDPYSEGTVPSTVGELTAFYA
jgi:acyl carrier protein